MINSKLESEYKIAHAPPNVLNLGIVENFEFGQEAMYPKHHNMKKLKQHIANFVNYDNIMVTNGSGAALDIILQCFMNNLGY